MQPIVKDLDIFLPQPKNEPLIESKILCLQNKYVQALELLRDLKSDNNIYVDFIKFICSFSLGEKEKANNYFKKFKKKSSKKKLEDLFFFLPKR